VRIFNNIKAFENPQRPVVLTAGTFDGVHIGHRKILTRLKQVADEVGGETVLLTFDPHPRSVLQPDSPMKMLSTLKEKQVLLERFGLDHLIVHPFTKEFSRTSSLEFVRDLLVNSLHVKKLVIGYDHHFGRNREGSFEHLKEFGPVYGFDVEEIEALDVDHVNVSSTKIRNALLEGDLQTASTYLSYDYTISGTVVHGKRLGRSIGFPTANLDVASHQKLIPGSGVYAVNCEVKGRPYHGMLNIGLNPTVNEDDQVRMEVNIFDFNEDIYGENVRVTFKHRIRNEQKFDSVETLRTRLEADRLAALHLLAG
jgi:riboflavin kinase/FMN adenylyltransferase